MNAINKHLDAETIAVLKSSVDFLAQHGTTITRLFYQKLLTAHPELNNLFSASQQANGEQQQALAKAVYGFAAHLDDLDQLAEQISRIAHKHTSLQVQAEQYPIVGENLLAAIHEVVSEEIDATAADTITTAWGKGYGVLANMLISAEQQLYQQAAGWKGLREFALVKREDESEAITSFYYKCKKPRAPRVVRVHWLCQ